MFKLSEIEKKSIEKRTGMSFSEIKEKNFDEIEVFFKSNLKKEVKFSSKLNNNLLARGNVFINLGRFVFSKL